MARELGKLAAVCALWSCATSSTALAASVTQPGETVGIAVGAPLPEGVYFVNTADWGCRDTEPESACLGVTIPVVVWSTPWTFLNARVEFLAAWPALELGIHHTDYLYSAYNPVVLGQLAWDLGNGFGFKYSIGAYFETGGELAWNSTSLNQRFALSYTGNDWNITAHLIWGIHFDSVSDRAQISPCPAPIAFRGCNPDFLNLDLTFVKKLGKWQIGPVAFGSTDLNSPVDGYREQSQFAIGGLVGYDFGPLTLQTYLTTDVYEKNYGGHDTRIWSRVIIPIWTAPTTPTRPIITKG